MSATTSPWYPHRRDAGYGVDCRCAAKSALVRRDGELWGDHCPVAMREEINRLTAELAGLRAYLTRSIANDLDGMGEACEILGNLSAQDREMVDAWTKEMSDPAYWSRDVAELRATLANERAAWVDMRADVLQGGWTNGDSIEINDVLDKIDEYMPDACVAPATKEPR